MGGFVGWCDVSGGWGVIVDGCKVINLFWG